MFEILPGNQYKTGWKQVKIGEEEDYLSSNKIEQTQKEYIDKIKEITDEFQKTTDELNNKIDTLKKIIEEKDIELHNLRNELDNLKNKWFYKYVIKK